MTPLWILNVILCRPAGFTRTVDVTRNLTINTLDFWKRVIRDQKHTTDNGATMIPGRERHETREKGKGGLEINNCNARSLYHI